MPPHNLYRRLDELLDFRFLYEATQDLYSHTGQPLLDPVVFFKLVLVGRLENLVSDRRLLEHCALRLDILLFLGYGLDETLPWHSTLSRTRQLFPAALFEQLFDRVFALCVAQGLVAGNTQAVDSAPIKANASLESLQPKQLAQADTVPSAAILTADLATDTYSCTAGKALPFQKYDTSADGSWLKIYWASYQDCHHCPLKSTCVPTARRKQLTRTAYDPAYRRAWARQQSRQGDLMRRKRQSTVEPVFGNLIHHYGLRRVGTRGKAGAQKTMLLTAVAYNLKKLLKHQPRKYRTVALALPPPPPMTLLFKLRTRHVVVNRHPKKNLTANGARVLQQPPPFSVTIRST